MISYQEAAAEAGQTLIGAELVTLYEACRAVETLPGCVAEVGVYRGGSARLMARCLPGKTIHLYDTFRGIPENDDPYEQVAPGMFAASLSAVRTVLAPFVNVHIHAGYFPDTVGPEKAEEYCLVHLDTDLYGTTRDGLALYFPRLVESGRILVHDYGYEACPGVKPAVDEFMAGAPDARLEVVERTGSLSYAIVTRKTEGVGEGTAG